MPGFNTVGKVYKNQLLGARSTEVSRADRQLENMAQRMRRLDAEEDDFLERAYRDQRSEKKRLADELARLEADASSVDGQSIEKQLAVDPREIIPALFEEKIPAERLRALLSRIFPRIVLSGRPYKFTSVWTVSVCSGAVVACLSATKAVTECEKEYVIHVETGATRPTRWHVTMEGESVAVGV